MFTSNREFTRGRADGKRDASWSLMDNHASWTWLWMTNTQYQQGYEQGWKEGRAEVKFRQDQERSRKEREQQKSQENAEPPMRDMSL